MCHIYRRRATPQSLTFAVCSFHDVNFCQLFLQCSVHTLFLCDTAICIQYTHYNGNASSTHISPRLSTFGNRSLYAHIFIQPIVTSWYSATTTSTILHNPQVENSSCVLEGPRSSLPSACLYLFPSLACLPARCPLTTSPPTADTTTVLARYGNNVNVINSESHTQQVD